MLYIDAKFAGFVGSRLKNFKQKGDYVWNYSCPVCGDSSKNKLKARGYIYRRKTELFCKCHNCSYGSNLGNLIKYVDSNLYNEYVLERYKSGASKYTDHKDAGLILPVQTPVEDLLEDDILSSITRIDLLDPSHPAVNVVADRKIPKDKWHLLYFAPKFKKYTNSVVPKFREPFVDEHPRMIIPLFTTAGKCFAFQGRAYGAEDPKYYTIKVDETQEKIFGLERIDYSKHIYVVEGPIDSLFLPNCLAVSGASFDTPTVRQIMTNCTVVMDNEPRNKEIVKQMKKYIELGYSVCMYPDTVAEKDINDMVLAGRTPEQILELINTNTFSGMEAQLRFTNWSKV